MEVRVGAYMMDASGGRNALTGLLIHVTVVCPSSSPTATSSNGEGRQNAAVHLPALRFRGGDGGEADDGAPRGPRHLRLVLDYVVTHAAGNASKTCLWTIGQIPKDKSPLLFGNLRLEEGLAHLHTLPTFQVKFKIMGGALSGLQIDKLEVKNTLSGPCKGFRAQTQAGKYDVRS
ncbi:uncharacterized protein LOC133884052 [Phragmites australis]|uniref:uncharacterized protein LOC133884052 n=1 Tax=Phragmites australis TaxID=29695 RepID=UPI002D77618E|nr:uncharacterized protein LOC133884052 [Phragmites australis]